MEVFQPLDFVWFGPVDDISGIANVNRNVVLAAMKMGLRIKCEPALQWWSHLKADLSKEKMELLNEAKARSDIRPGGYIAVWSFPPHYLQKTEPNVPNMSYSLFESDRIPITWIPKLNNPAFAEVWVPCSFQLESYKRGGIQPSKIKKLPMGVDTEDFTPEGLRMQLAPNKEFTFLTVMDVSYRKYPELMLQAYFEAFKDEEDVLLVFKGYTGGADEDSKNYIRNMIKKYKEQAQSRAKLLYLSGFLKDSQFPLLHRSVDVFVNSSRGEGWSLPVLQSMACGVPCIMPKHSSHLDFGTDQNCLWVDVKEVEITDQKFLTDDSRFLTHRWWEPQLESMKKQFRFAYENREQMKTLGKQAHLDAQAFSWKHTVRKMVAQSAKFSQRRDVAVVA